MYLLQRLVVRALRTGGADALEVEEAPLALVPHAPAQLVEPDARIIHEFQSPTPGADARYGRAVAEPMEIDDNGGLDLLGSAAVADVVYILAGDPRPCAADVDRDGSVDVLDFLAIVAAFREYDRFADLDHDGDIDVLDFLAWLRAKAECR